MESVIIKDARHFNDWVTEHLHMSHRTALHVEKAAGIAAGTLSRLKTQPGITLYLALAILDELGFQLRIEQKRDPEEAARMLLRFKEANWDLGAIFDWET